MYKGAVMALLLNTAAAAPIGDQAPSDAPATDPAQANWHGGGHRGGGGGQGGGGNGGGDGGVIVNLPYPSGSGTPSPTLLVLTLILARLHPDLRVPDVAPPTSRGIGLSGTIAISPAAIIPT
jgi:hypothetical protein